MDTSCYIGFRLLMASNTRRLENVESEVQRLRGQIDEMHQILRRGSPSTSTVGGEQLPALQQETLSASNGISHVVQTAICSCNDRPAKKRCSGIESQIRDEAILDFVTKGLVSVERAIPCFET